MSTVMNNVVPFRRPSARAGVRPAAERCEVIAVADDLFAAIDDLRALVGRAALMRRPAIEVERTVQNLLDAITAIEKAVDCVGEGGGSEASPA